MTDNYVPILVKLIHSNLYINFPSNEFYNNIIFFSNHAFNESICYKIYIFSMMIKIELKYNIVAKFALLAMCKDYKTSMTFSSFLSISSHMLSLDWRIHHAY